MRGDLQVAPRANVQMEAQIGKEDHSGMETH
ncbi:hypothetical protein TRIP_B50305 [uncultured Desulfatiglans sp.]|uniref:Uncharacterized protein n=1 Tax=Uncultured Desulfatiglans sp. TaxID=1748965 RepID=A0A653AI41_UNCDX|nr:hypothetical protein TRIP_B50305 [uncultured Desulfatiglans sp.]